MINYVTGDATDPQGDGPKVIIHCCNSIGAWGAGFVLALSKKWNEPELQYLNWHHCFGGEDLPLGIVQFVRTEDDLYVANMIGQNGVRSRSNPTPIDYGAFKKGLQSVFRFARKNGGSIHAPRFGAGLAGGDWERIEFLIDDCQWNDEVDHAGTEEIPVTIYDLP